MKNKQCNYFFIAAIFLTAALAGDLLAADQPVAQQVLLGNDFKVGPGKPGVERQHQNGHVLEPRHAP